MIKQVIAKLKEHDMKVAFAESITGGAVAASFVSVSGASDVFNESFIVYSNESKTKRLGLTKRDLDHFGAVHPLVASLMARNVAQLTKSDIGIATTGIAGPTGGTKRKPVGLVYIGMYMHGVTNVRKFIFKGSRKKIIAQTVFHAQKMLHDTFHCDKIR